MSDDLLNDLRKLAYGRAFRIVGRCDTAEDVAQDVVVRYLQQEPGAVEKPRQWIRRVTELKCGRSFKSSIARRLADIVLSAH